MVNRYSATVGGPVYLPKLYDGRNRTFWTYGFQGFNRRNPNNNYYTVPTEAERRGDFSALLRLRTANPNPVPDLRSGHHRRQPYPRPLLWNRAGATVG